MVLISSLSTVVMALIAVVCFFPALSLGERRRMVAFLVLGAVVALSPILIPLQHRPARIMASGFALLLVMKMWDLHVGALRGERLHFSEFLAFFANLFLLVLRKKGHERQPTTSQNLWNLAVGIFGCAAAFMLMVPLLKFDWTGIPFLLEHGLKATVFFGFAVAFFQTCVATTRFIGGYLVSFSDQPLMARTPAEFWRRYNRLVGQFLHEDVFKLLRGRRCPIRATVGVFLVSGLIHEYLFWIVIGRPEGFQMMFFLVQGCAVALTLRIKPTGREALVWGGVTFVFNLMTSVFFFASIQSVIGFYHGGLPAWLRIW